MKKQAVKSTLKYLFILGVCNSIHTTAFSASPYQITFINSADSITKPFLTNLGASSNQVMRYTGTNWIASSIGTDQIYRGTWNAFTNLPNLTIPSTAPGDFYLVTVAGSLNSISYAPGDWIISNGASWEKIGNSANLVSSINARRAAVTLIPQDYVLLKNGSGKIPSSTLNDLANLNLVSSADQNVIKYDSVSSKWINGSDAIGGTTYSGTPSKAVATNGSGALTTVSSTATEVGYLSSTSSSIQSQLNSLQTKTLANGNILIGNISNVPTSEALSGAATMLGTGVLSLKNTGTAGTYTSVTIDSKGLVSAGTNPSVASITALTSDVVASGSGSVAAAIAANAVNSSKILNGSILPTDLDFTGTIINTSGLMIRNLAGGFSSLVCSILGNVPTWSVTGFHCADAGSGTVSGTSGKIVKFASASASGNSLLSESSTVISLNGILDIPTTTASVGYLTINGNRFVSNFKGLFLGNNSGNLTHTGSGNTGIGESSMRAISTGTTNTTMGSFTARYLTTGSTNVLIGESTGSQLTAGARNVYVGYTTGSGRSTGTSNVYIGAGIGALWTGSQNTTIGAESAGGGSSFGGGQNTFLGFQAGWDVQGGRNVFLGYKSGYNVNTGSYNVIIGGHLGANIDTLSNIILIADGAGNERMRVGSTGLVGIGTLTSSYLLQVGNAMDGTEARANSWVVLSDQNLKKDFEIIPDALKKILSLNGYYYRWNDSVDQRLKIGVKAQEVEKVFPEIVSLGSDGYLSVSYDHLVAGVISSVKEFHHLWIVDNNLIHSELDENDKMLLENKKVISNKFSKLDENIKLVKNDNKSIRDYLCSKDLNSSLCSHSGLTH